VVVARVVAMAGRRGRGRRIRGGVARVGGGGGGGGGGGWRGGEGGAGFNKRRVQS